MWIIATFPSLKIDIDEYPVVRDYLSTFGSRLEQSGLPGCRKKTFNKWFETQDSISYWEDFFREKIVYPDIMRLPKNKACLYEYPYFYFDNKNYLAEATNFIMTGSHLHSIFSVLTSRLGTLAFTHFYSGPQFDEKGFRYKKEYIQNMPISTVIFNYNSIFQNVLDNISTKMLSKLDYKSEINTIENMVNDIYELNGQEKDYLNGLDIVTASME